MKPKVKRFGFSKKVFKSVAAKIAGKLKIDDEASDEEVESKINEAIDAYLPDLSLIQSLANQQLEEWKKSQKKDDENDEDDVEDDVVIDDDDNNIQRNNRRNRQTKSAKTAENREMKQLLEVVGTLTKEISALKEGKTTESRRTKIEKLLKDSGTFGKRILKDFSKMTFKDEEEFEDYYSEVEDDWKAWNQERANAGLSTMGNPPGGKGNKQETKMEELTDAEIDAIAELL
ncbi:MAG: hypothetical protein NC548_49580 [Lachnospiraceae bacterium]|nr:hypothetical protein [Lachnospiraceae bacterium]